MFPEPAYYFFSHNSNLRNSSVSPFVCLSVCLSVIKLSKQLHISSLPLSMLASYLTSLCQAIRLSSISLALASYLISLCKAIRLSSISLYLLLAISLDYVRPSGLALYLSSSCQQSHQSMLGHQPQLHLSLLSLSSLSVVSSKGIATVSHLGLFGHCESFIVFICTILRFSSTYIHDIRIFLLTR